MLHQIDLSRANLNLLVLFDAVMTHRHVGRAAEQLHLSPSAVSHGLGRLRVMLADPLFLKTPKGVEPTERAAALAPAIADILARVRGVVATAKPFDPSTSRRRFVVGAPDGVSSVILPPLLQHLRRSAPHIGIAVRQVLPKAGEQEPALAWRDTLADMEARALDVAVMPVADAPARFYRHVLYEEDFVICMRAKHPLARRLTLETYCDAQHLVVSETGDAYGFVDAALAKRKKTRHVTLTVPNFMFALASIAATNLIAALPRRFVAMHGKQYGLIARESPMSLPAFPIALVTPKAALADEGLEWLVSRIRSSPSS